MKLKNVGEKRLIAEYIRPLFNPLSLRESVGDDCALIPVSGDLCVCISTDRVPADLISYKLGLIGFKELGYYLAVLNISDIAAAGGMPKGLLLNLALPPNFDLQDLLDILNGAKNAAEEYGAPILGGDLSDAKEMNLVATSLGIVLKSEALYRSGAHAGDVIFCTDYIGLSATAFAHYLYKGPLSPMSLDAEQERLLTMNFRHPRARVTLGRRLAEAGCCTAAMDVTDGVSQSLSEIATASGIAMVLDESRLPIHPVSQTVASHYGLEPVDMVLGAAADFQLIGTLNPSHAGFKLISNDVQIIGEAIAGTGVYIRNAAGKTAKLEPRGWNYYIEPSE